MLPALDAILGHRSAHSFDTGPVMAEPFISPLLFTITPALSSKYKNVPSLRRIVLRCRMTTAGITFFLNERNRVGRFLQNVMGVNEMALPQFGLSFFDGGKHHVPICSGWETIEAPTYSSDGNNIKVLCSQKRRATGLKISSFFPPLERKKLLGPWVILIMNGIMSMSGTI